VVVRVEDVCQPPSPPLKRSKNRLHLHSPHINQSPICSCSRDYIITSKG